MAKPQSTRKNTRHSRRRRAAREASRRARPRLAAKAIAGQCEEDERRPQLPQREKWPSRTKQLHDDSGQHQHATMHASTAKLLSVLATRVEILAHGRRRQNLADARVGVALHANFSRCRSRPAKETSSSRPSSARRSTPSCRRRGSRCRRTIQIFSAAHRIRQVQRRRQGKQKTVAPHALQEIGADHVVQDAGVVHAARSGAMTATGNSR